VIGHDASPTPQPAPEEVRRRPVGVFDSGVGGLTVLHELLVQLPAEDFVYLADSARFPYGSRTGAELEGFALEVAEELISRRVKLLVVACNSATPALRERLRQTTLGVDVLGVVQPGAVQAVAATRNGRVGLLATPATVDSGSYARAIAGADPFVNLTSVACPDLAAIIEAGFPFDNHVVDTVRAACMPLREAGVDTVVLGCTHYPLVRPMLQRMLGRRVNIIVSGDPLAHQVEHVLGARGLANPRGDEQAGRAGGPGDIVEGDYSFLCTGDTQAFRELGTRFLQLPLGEVEPVALGTGALVAGARR
jgi:glutamate racemase